MDGVTATRLVDVSHTIEQGMITYKGLPAPLVCDFLSREESRGHYAPGTEFVIHRVELVGNTGTYIDAPFHRYAEGRDIAGLELGELAHLPGIVIRAPGTAGRGGGPPAVAGAGGG